MLTVKIFPRLVLGSRCAIAFFLKFNKQILKNDYFETFKGRRVFVISIADV